MQIQKPINVISTEWSRASDYDHGRETDFQWRLISVFQDRSSKKFELRIVYEKNKNEATKVLRAMLRELGWFAHGEWSFLESGGVVECDLLDMLQEWWDSERTVGICAHVRSDADEIRRVMDELRARQPKQEAK